MAAAEPSPSLSVVVADERAEGVEAAARVVSEAGHRVVAKEKDLGAIGNTIARLRPDVVVVAVSEHEEYALDLVEQINDTAACPVVLLLDDDDPELVRAALARGIDAYADRATPGALDSAIQIAQHRFRELDELGRQVGALEAGAQRRASIERAKGILMERHDVDERAAYDMLRRRARDHRMSVAQVADAVIAARTLLPPERANGDDGGDG